MGRKQILKAFKVLDEVMDEDRTGEETTVEQLDRAIYSISWQNGVANDGEIVIEVTFDDVTWSELPYAPALLIDTAEGNAVIHLNDITWLKMRPKFKDNSAGLGAGELEITLKASTAGA